MNFFLMTSRERIVGDLAFLTSEAKLVTPSYPVFADEDSQVILISSTIDSTIDTSWLFSTYYLEGSAPCALSE